MELYCYEEMATEVTLNLKKVKTLFELATERLFWNDYYCNYCGLFDFDCNWLEIHVKYSHDESGRVKQIYRCRACNQIVMVGKLISHFMECLNS